MGKTMKTQKELFEEIYDKTFDVESLVKAIRCMAALHQEGTTVDYDSVDYTNLCYMARELIEEINTLAMATDLERENEVLSPIAAA